MWSIALKTLIADRGKLLTALVGVVFSIVLVNVQGGLFLGLLAKAGLLVSQGEADVWVGHRSMHNVDFPDDIPRHWIYRVRSVPGVARVEPYLIGFSETMLPSGMHEGATVVGAPRGSELGRAWNVVEGRASDLAIADAVIVDRMEDAKLEHPRLGEVREVGGHRARVVAKSEGIIGFLVHPYVFTTYDRAAVYTGKNPAMASYFLVKLEPDADAGAVCAEIRRRLPQVDAYTRDEYSAISVDFWMTRTGLGISFGAATLLGLLVGMVMVAQTLYAMVLDRLDEFGTLKALGASERHIYQLLFTYAAIMAAVGSVIGLLLVAGIQRFYSTPQAPILIPWWLASGSVLLVLAICLASSLLPYLRIRRVDPLTVLQA